ncbi:MAG: chemotaxis protein CheW [Acidobacteriota bacterium]
MTRGKEKPAEKTAVKVGPLPLELISNPATVEATSQVSVLMFTTGGNRFSIGVEQTEGVVDCPRVSPLPNPPDGIVGVTSVRGRMTLVMDLSLAPSQPASKRRLILVKGDAQLGLLADHVEGVLALEPKQLRAAGAKTDPASKSREVESVWPAKFYFKSDGRRVPIVDIDKLSE